MTYHGQLHGFTAIYKCSPIKYPLYAHFLISLLISHFVFPTLLLKFSFHQLVVKYAISDAYVVFEARWQIILLNDILNAICSQRQFSLKQSVSMLEAMLSCSLILTPSGLDASLDKNKGLLLVFALQKSAISN